MNTSAKICKIETFLNQAINESFMARNDKMVVTTDQEMESSLKSLVKTRRDLMAQLFNAKENAYKKTTALNIAKRDNEILRNVLNTNMDNKNTSQTNQMNKIGNDIMTQNKQFQIAENEFRKKKYYIFIWKHITAFSVLSLLTLLFLKTNHISTKVAYTIISVLFIFLLLILVINYYIFKKRNVIYFNKYNWRTKTDISQQGVCEN